MLGQLTQQAVARQFGPLGATLVTVTPQPPLPPPGAEPGGVPGVPVNIAVSAGGAPKPVIPPELDEKDLPAIASLPHVHPAALHGIVPPVQEISNGQNG